MNEFWSEGVWVLSVLGALGCLATYVWIIAYRVERRARRDRIRAAGRHRRAMRRYHKQLKQQSEAWVAKCRGK